MRLPRIHIPYLLATIALAAAIFFSYQIVVANPEKLQQDIATAALARATCLNAADKKHNDAWNSTCATLAGQQVTKYLACEQTNTKSFCDSSIGFATIPITGCALPVATSNALADQLKNDKDDCFKEFPAK
jgi:hypothetical protein